MKRRIICFFSILLTIATSIFAQQEQTATEQMKAYLEETDSPITAHNRIHLLRNGQEKFDNLFAELRKAKHHIHLEYFNLRNDSITKELMLILAEKCQEGVEVRVLFDAFGNFSNNAPLKKKHLAQIRPPQNCRHRWQDWLRRRNECGRLLYQRIAGSRRMA